MKSNELGKIDSVIFDLDGTLWNSTEVCLKAWHNALNSLTYIKEPISKSDIEGIFGLKHDIIGEKLFPYLSKEQQNYVMNCCFESEIEMIKKYGGILFENIDNVLKYLFEKYELCIVSNCQSGYVEAFYHFHKLDLYFKDHECSGNTGLPKKNNIKSIIERNCLKNPVFVGDTMDDYEATKDNKLPFIFAEYGFGEVDNPDYKISSLNMLIDIL